MLGAGWLVGRPQQVRGVANRSPDGDDCRRLSIDDAIVHRVLPRLGRLVELSELIIMCQRPPVVADRCAAADPEPAGGFGVADAVGERQKGGLTVLGQL